MFIFDHGYKMVYQCVCEVLAWWLAINGVIVNVENIMSVISLTVFL